jgi:glycosyltransferase involved in cell wall biosynthesis
VNPKNFSLILPTHNHPGLVKRLFRSIVDTTKNLDRLEIVLYLDDDDLESRALTHPLLNLVKLIKHSDDMGNILRTCYDASSARYVMLANDDMIFKTQGWDETVIKTFAGFPDDIGMVYGNDLYYGKLMSTFPILSRTACELMDKICPAQYKWHCIDAHIFDIFTRLSLSGYKRTAYLKNVIFEHMHHELSAAINDPDLVPMSDRDDQALYFSLEESRRETVNKMVEHIKKGEKCR